MQLLSDFPYLVNVNLERTPSSLPAYFRRKHHQSFSNDMLTLLLIALIGSENIYYPLIFTFTPLTRANLSDLLVFL